MVDRIPITVKSVRALGEYVCAREDCSQLLASLHLEDYLGSKLSFARGEAGDGTIYIEADGRNVIELRENGTMIDLVNQTQIESRSNFAKAVIAAIFGCEELKITELSDQEKKQAERLGREMGIERASDRKVNPSENALPSSVSKPDDIFLFDRWKGWRLGVEASFNQYQKPGGGAKLWFGYRDERWEIRLTLQNSAVKIHDNRYEVRFSGSIEPIFHIEAHPLVLDPFLYLPEIGIYHLGMAESFGLAISTLGAGLQIHLCDTCSIYAGAKMTTSIGFNGLVVPGAEVPLGFNAKF